MDESAKKSTRASNLEKMSPEKRAKLAEFDAALDKYLAEALKQGVEEDVERRNKKDAGKAKHGQFERDKD